VTLTLYTKHGCHLCDDVRSTLDELQADHVFALEEIDITTNAELFARYRFDIPVLLKDGLEVARGRIADRELLEILRPEA
jgi:glutaredoxin